ncbi:T9SS type A sorting domain-containing protein [Marivirga salinae]|uniref:T9SS type A sorting domain-containing protein n=1 Tax=Marivirga salinarum TaxID=3059078 RepID=A0AA51N9J7_9BACT|nr:T9SS type A sorting domain-containing protein [Marivirga sp. BDSF4-3]WMN11346.1 T9SS type A sorting domain-containing protein [Marivirga sp. BDSF4-3]
MEAQLLNGASSGSWSGGDGNFTSTNSQVTTYTPDPSEYGSIVTLTYTANDPDGSGPCNTASDAISFTVNTLPTVGITGDPFPNGLYCVRNGLEELTGTPAGGVFTGRGVVDNGDGTFDFDPNAATVGGPYTITYTYENANGCSNIAETVVEVTNGPISSFDIETDDSNNYFCSNAILELEPDDPNGDFTGNGIEVIGGITYFNAASAELAGQDTVEITYSVTESATSCTATTTKRIIRIPEPEITIEYQNLCDVDNAVQILINPGYNNDQDSLVSYQLEYENAPNRIYEVGQIEQFNSPGTKEITVIGTTFLGCTFESTTTINVGNIQSVDFSFSNTKTSSSGEEPTQFNNESFLDGVNSITSYKWDFGIEGSNTDTSSMANPTFNFEVAGTYSVQLIIESSLGCTDSIRKNVAIVPAISSYPYYETFNSNSGGWTTKNIIKDSLSSWTYGTSNGAFEGKNDNQNPGYFWKTAANGEFGYYQNENSFLEGPSFDLTSLEKPMIAFDMWLDVDDSFRAGATLEFSTDGGNSWNIFGELEDELNWYNTSNISPIGGTNSNPLNYAWYFIAEERNWIRVAHVIDESEISNLESVKFRINFKGTLLNSNPSGMAIDNFYVGERQKLVLLENFTNLNADNYINNRSSVQNLMNTKIANDVLPLNFHISMPFPDSVNFRNSVELDSRASIYSIDESPKLVIDGEIFNENIFEGNVLNNSLLQKVTRRSLLEPSELIDISIDNAADKHTISFNATLKPNQETTKNLKAYFFIVEKSTNKGNELKNIVRKILPNINGFNLNDLSEPSTNNYQWAVESIYTNEELAIISIVQDRNTNKILEIKVNDINQPKYQNTITNVKNGFESLGINVYPNPSRGEVQMIFNKELNSDLKIFILDSNGKIIQNTKIKKGSLKAELNLSGLASGVYHIISKDSDGKLNRQKIVIID